MERRPVVIVGSGPAGTSSALYLCARDRTLAADALILEKARHPRPKVCAGGLIPHTLECLRDLGIDLTVPSVSVRRGRVCVPGGTVDYEDGELCRVIRRDAFDHSLVTACRARGVEVREGEKVRVLRREAGGICIETDHAEYHARVVIGADGSGSAVRRQLLDDAGSPIARAIMCDVPVADVQWDGWEARRYDFSFADVRHGLRGYSWIFPCLIDGRPHVNIGVYSAHAAGSGALLSAVLQRQLRVLGAPAVPVKSFPIRCYGQGRVTAPNVLLVGDAAGVEALMGEGISYAFDYGRWAATATADALATGRLDFAGAERELRASWMGKKLRRLDLGARLFYGKHWRLWFALARASRTAQHIGVRWYNGVDGWDRRSGWVALGAWLRGRAAGSAPRPPLAGAP